MTPVPCLWLRVTCWGERDHGLVRKGCGYYDIPVPGHHSIKAIKLCVLCRGSNIDIDVQGSGVTSRVMFQPTGEPKKMIIEHVGVRAGTDHLMRYEPKARTSNGRKRRGADGRTHGTQFTRSQAGPKGAHK